MYDGALVTCSELVWQLGRCWASLAYGVWVATALRSDSRVARGTVFIFHRWSRSRCPLRTHPGKESVPPIVALLGLLGMVLTFTRACRMTPCLPGNSHPTFVATQEDSGLS